MAESTEVIQHQMEETRARLADNLDKLSKQALDTVDEVKSTVGEVATSVASTVEAVQETVESVQEKVTETVGTVADTVQQTVVDVKGFFDIPGHVDRHPWATLGSAFAVGFVAGQLLPGSPRSHAEGSAAASLPTSGRETAPQETPPNRLQDFWPPREEKPAQESWFSGITSAFAPALEKLKGLAIGTALGLARESLTKSLTGELASKAREMIDDVTQKLGGQTIRSADLEALQNLSPLKGDDHGKRDATKMDRPVGSGSW